MGGILQTMTHQRHPKALDGFADDSIFWTHLYFSTPWTFCTQNEVSHGSGLADGDGKGGSSAPPGKCNQRNVLNLKLQLSVGWWFLYTYPHKYFSGFGLKGTFTTWFPGCQVRAYSKAGMGPWSVSSDAMQAARRIRWDLSFYDMLCNFHEETIYIILYIIPRSFFFARLYGKKQHVSFLLAEYALRTTDMLRWITFFCGIF